MEPVCIALKAHLGWVNAVAVARNHRHLRCLRAERVELLPGGDRNLREPYHVAGGWQGLDRVPPPADPAAVVSRGRRRQVESATRVLSAYREQLAAAGMDWTRAVLLTGRGRLGDDLSRILASHAQIHVAEGEAIREAVRCALGALGVELLERDEKRVPDRAAQAFGGRDPDAELKASRPDPVSAWRREERLLAMAAWLDRR